MLTFAWVLSGCSLRLKVKACQKPLCMFLQCLLLISAVTSVVGSTFTPFGMSSKERTAVKFSSVTEKVH